MKDGYVTRLIDWLIDLDAESSELGCSEVPVKYTCTCLWWQMDPFFSFEDDDDVVCLFSLFLSFAWESEKQKKVLWLLVSSLKVSPMHTVQKKPFIKTPWIHNLFEGRLKMHYKKRAWSFNLKFSYKLETS